MREYTSRKLGVAAIPSEAFAGIEEFAERMRLEQQIRSAA
jgi:hypothetical protein